MQFLRIFLAYMQKKQYLRTPPVNNNHPRRKPLLPNTEGRSALRNYVRTVVQTTIICPKNSFLCKHKRFFRSNACKFGKFVVILQRFI